MTVIECQKVQELLDDYVHNNLDKETSGEILRHLVRCRECRKFYEEMKQFKDLVYQAWNLEVKKQEESVEVDHVKSLDWPSGPSRRNAKFGVFSRIAAVFVAGLLVGGVAVAVAFSYTSPVTPAYGTNMILTDVPGTIENAAFQQAGLRLVAEGAVEGIRAMAPVEEGVLAGINGRLVLFNQTEKVVYGQPAPEMVAIDGLVGLPDGGALGYGRSRVLVRFSSDADTVEVLGAPQLENGQFISGLYTDGSTLYAVDQAGYYHRYDPEKNSFTVGVKLPENAIYNGVDPAEWPEEIRASLEKEFGSALSNHAARVENAQGNEVTYALIEYSESFLFDSKKMEFKRIARGSWQEVFNPKVVLDGKVYGFVGEELACYDLEDGSLKPLAEIGMQGPMVRVGDSIYIFSLSTYRYDAKTGELTDLGKRVYGLLPDSPAVVGPDGKIYIGTHYLGGLFRFDPATNELEAFGRPLPELGQESGEEVAPIEGLAFAKDGTLYGVIGTGAALTGSSHLFRFDPERGKVIDSFSISAPLTKLVSGEGDFIYVAMDERIGVLLTQR